MKSILIILIPLAVVGVLLILLQTVFLIGYVPSGSMEPTLREKSFLLGLRRYGTLNVGDIIIFKHEDKTFVKRIAAVGGDSMKIDNKNFRVPKDCYFVLGDNADNSFDSRYWDRPYVSKKDILAKLILPKN